MKCNTLKVIEFRNFKEKEIDLSDQMIILQGENGIGKTNIIEALYLASFGKSFRSFRDEEMIHFGQNEGTVILSFTVRGTTHILKIKLSRDKGKKMFINETETKRKEWLGFFKTVLFTPDELQLIKGTPQGRRRFLDMEISQISPRYYEEILKYTRAVQQRNFAFKNEKYRGIPADIDIWDMQIAKRATYIVKKRKEFIGMMNKIMSPMETYLTGNKEKLNIRYKKAGGDVTCFTEEWYLQKLAENRKKDGELFHTSVGPHRDDFIFEMNGYDISSYGSQGQQRTAIIVWKLSEMELIKKETGEYPVLLLDDIDSELDQERKEKLFSYLNQKKIQTIITSTKKDFPTEGKKINLSCFT